MDRVEREDPAFIPDVWASMRLDPSSPLILLQTPEDLPLGHTMVTIAEATKFHTALPIPSADWRLRADRSLESALPADDL